MPIAPRIPQHHSEIVDVAGWEPDFDMPIPPSGRRAKQILVAPSPPPFGFLIGGHRYLFKMPSTQRERSQIWSEVLAYEIGNLAGVPVPPAFLALNSATGEIGVLIEFFFGHPGQPGPDRFVHAIDRFQAFNVNMNYNRGSLKDNIALTRAHSVPSWRSWWAQTITFDALISNGDRHSENWGFLVERSEAAETSYTLAPAFDNGSSLGWQVGDAQLALHLTGAKLESYLSRGRHHYGWTSNDAEGAAHTALCEKYISIYADCRNIMYNVVSWNDSELEALITRMGQFAYPAALTGYRSEFVSAIVRAKKRRLVELLGED